MKLAAKAKVTNITEADILTDSLTAVIVTWLLFGTQNVRALGSFIVLVSMGNQAKCNDKTVILCSPLNYNPSILYF